MHIAKLITSSWICSQIEKQKLKHSFRLPPFWQTPCNVLADLSNGMVLIVSRGFGSVCKQHSFAMVSFCVMELCRHCKCVVLMSSILFFVSCRTVKETKGHGTILMFPKSNGFIVSDSLVHTIEVEIKN